MIEFHRERFSQSDLAFPEFGIFFEAGRGKSNGLHKVLRSNENR